MNNSKLITIKVTAETRRLLRVLAAYSGKMMHEVAERLAQKEHKRLKLK